MDGHCETPLTPTYYNFSEDVKFLYDLVSKHLSQVLSNKTVGLFRIKIEQKIENFLKICLQILQIRGVGI